MPGFLKRFGRGAVAGGGGAAQGFVQHLLMQAERERFEGEQAEKLKTGDLQRQLMQLQIEDAQQGEPEKITEGGEFGRLLREDPDEYIRIKRAISGKGETKPPKTGIGTLEDVLTGRQEFHEGERGEFVKRAESLAPEIDFRETTPEGVRKELLSFLPQGDASFKTGRFSTETADPSIISGEQMATEEMTVGDITEVLRMLGIPLEPYQVPQGAGLSALSDSVQTAQIDPATAGALLDYRPGARGQQQDPEILKAQQALKRGDIDQATFDDFVKERNASYVR